MTRQQWRQPTTADQALRRACARRSYNAARRRQAEQRRRVLTLWRAGCSMRVISRHLGVHRSTISRDVARLQRQEASGTASQ